MQLAFAERFVALEPVDVELVQPLDPERQRALRHGEHGLADLAGAGPAARDVGKREIGHHPARPAELVAVVEVVDLGRIEIHCLLDAAQPERPGEERIVLRRGAGKRGDVVQAANLVEPGHGTNSVRRKPVLGPKDKPKRRLEKPPPP